MREGPFQFGLINDNICEALGDKTAIVQGNKRVSYAELGSRSRRLARVFTDAGLGCHADPADVQPWECVQDRIAVLSLNRPEFIESYQAGFKARCAPFNVNYRYTAHEIGQLFRDADAKAVVYEARFAPVLAEALEALDTPHVLLVCIEDDSGERAIPGSMDYETAISSKVDAPLDADYSDDEVLLIFTGGTTGMPKGVLWPMRELFLHTLTGQLPGEPRPESVGEQVQRVLDNPGPTMMVCPPLMHGAGLWSSLICGHQGGTVVYSPTPDHLDAHAILSACEREKVTMLGFTGDAFAIPIVEAMREGDYDLSSLFVLTTQAVALTPKTRNALHELLPNALVIESYGTTEGGFQGLRIGSANDQNIESGTFERVNATVLTDENRERILDPSETDVVGWTARPGRLPRGYLNDPEKTNDTFFEIEGTRYVVLGDRAMYRADGNMQFLGREAVCINTGGEKVFGEEVEATLKSHPSVTDAIVLGTPDERFGQKVTAVVSVADDTSDDELQQHCRDFLAGYKVPRAWVRVDRVPRLENGKPDYTSATATALERLGSSVS